MAQEFGSSNSTDTSLRLPLPQLAETSFATPLTSLPVLTDERLHEATGTRIAFTNRLGGMSATPYSSLNLSETVGDLEASVQANRRTLLDCLGAQDCFDALIVPKQVHGTEVLVEDGTHDIRPRAHEGADGVVCTQLDTPVLLCFADCVPVILVAPGGSFAVAHAGWRGALGGIPGIALEKLAEAASCDPADCNAYIGPHIGSCCYEVSPDLLERFVKAFGPSCEAPSSHLDLSAAVIVSLLRAGAQPTHIIDAKLCTACAVDRYYSYRAEGGTCGRQGAIAFKEEKTWD